MERKAVEEFLEKMSRAPAMQILRMHPNSENQACLVELGLTETNAKDEVRSLEVRHYSKGPEADRDRFDQEVWMFGKKIDGREVYIKLILKKIGVCVLSFHFAKHPIDKPFA